eukprot:EG_transcript_12138
MGRLRRQVDGLQQELLEARNLGSHRLAAMKDLEAEVTRLRNQLQAAEDDVQRSSQEVMDLERRLQHAEAVHEKAAREKTVELARLLATVEALNGELTALRALPSAMPADAGADTLKVTPRSPPEVAWQPTSQRLGKGGDSQRRYSDAVLANSHSNHSRKHRQKSLMDRVAPNSTNTSALDPQPASGVRLKARPQSPNWATAHREPGTAPAYVFRTNAAACRQTSPVRNASRSFERPFHGRLDGTDPFLNTYSGPRGGRPSPSPDEMWQELEDLKREAVRIRRESSRFA